MANTNRRAVCWHCTECNKIVQVKKMNIKSEAYANKKETKKFCNQCRDQRALKRKDMKKG